MTTVANDHIVSLGDVRCMDPALVGPKAAHLSALAESHPVPDGFCITAEAYRAAQGEGLPTELAQAIGSAYARLVGDLGPGAEPDPVAVRSSGIDEDGASASFAGQHETILNVVGLEALLDAVERTWRSLRSEGALAYRRAHGLPVEGMALAVLVQRLVVADASGVAFSVDPVGGRSDRIVVNAGWGLGESMVGGTVTPDTWSVDKATLEPVETTLSEKGRMTVAVAGGTREVTVPKFLASRPSLTPEQLRDVAALARTLETEQGWPVDVEFAFGHGRLHLLQCRPVTTTTEPVDEGMAAADSPAEAGVEAPVPEWREPGDAQRSWERDPMHFPEAVSALDGDLFRLTIQDGFNHGFEHYGSLNRMTLGVFWSRLYYSYARLELEAEAAQAAKERMAERLWPTIDTIGRVWSDEWLPEIEGHLSALRTFDLAGAPDGGLLAHWDDALTRLRRLWQLHFVLSFPVMMGRDGFIELFRELFEEKDPLDAFVCLQGLENRTLLAGRRLWSLRDVADATPSVRRLLRRLPPEAVVAALRDTPEAAPFLAAFERYLDEFGRRSSLMGVSRPTQREAPAAVVKMLQDALSQPTHDLELHHARTAKEREHALAEARSAIRHYPAPVREEFERRLVLAHAAARIHEDHNFLIDYQSFALVREVALEIGRRCVALGVLERPDDAVHLTAAELAETLAREGGLDRRELVAQRRDRFERDASFDAPRHVGAPPDPATAGGNDFSGRRPPESDDPTVVTGSAGSAGVARGRARVLHSIDEAIALQPGEVLVAPTTSQPWMPLFATAAALVTDTGGVLSHTAVVAREYRLPAVVGTVVGTSRLRTGMLLEVDGAAGRVRILEDAPSGDR
jgi:rifampicin phosphotransferase